MKHALFNKVTTYYYYHYYCYHHYYRYYWIVISDTERIVDAVLAAETLLIPDILALF